VVLGGDASVATNGFWSALTIATTQKLPMLFYIEDNGFGISDSRQLSNAPAAISRPIWRASGNLTYLGDGTSRRGGAAVSRR
jgi:2-oxoisovalerate dehydrogenase E1 component